MATDAFDLVRSFDQMRQRISGAAPQHEMVAAPTVAAPPVVAAAPTAPAAPTAAAPAASGAVGPNFAALQANFPGLKHTSGYRDPKHNAEVGGVPNSWHTQLGADGVSRANDYVGSVREMQNAAAWAKAHGAKEVLIHNVGSGQHLHVAW